MNLAELPRDHSLRNRPLCEIGAEYRNIQQKRWNPVGTIKIHKSTFNQLSGPWVECNEWRCAEEGVKP